LSYRLLQLPRRLSAADHDAALQRMRGRLAALPGVRAVYQIGGVSTPGISDLDMVAIFDDGVRCAADPRAGLSADDRYLFAHEIYGTHVATFREVASISSFHGYRLVHGDDLLVSEAMAPPPVAADQRVLETQIALEFLLKMYINLAVQRAYRALKVRGLFLHARALAYDMEFLGVASGPLPALIARFIEVRSHWFQQPLSAVELSDMADALFTALVRFLDDEALPRHRLWLPVQPEYPVGPMVRLEQGRLLAHRRRGTRAPRWLSILGERYFFGLQNRLNRFTVTVPFVTAGPPDILARRFELVAGMSRTRRADLPHFAVLTSSLFVP
jgi:hypothetical protein